MMVSITVKSAALLNAGEAGGTGEARGTGEPHFFWRASLQPAHRHIQW